MAQFKIGDRVKYRDVLDKEQAGVVTGSTGLTVWVKPDGIFGQIGLSPSDVYKTADAVPSRHKRAASLRRASTRSKPKHKRARRARTRLRKRISRRRRTMSLPKSPTRAATYHDPHDTCPACRRYFGIVDGRWPVHTTQGHPVGYPLNNGGIEKKCSRSGKAYGSMSLPRGATGKPRLTKDQKAALEAYNRANREEDRYLGSVFVTPVGQRRVEAATKAAYDRCKALGMGAEHGL